MLIQESLEIQGESMSDAVNTQANAIRRLVRRNSGGLPSKGISTSKQNVKRTKSKTTGGGTITKGGIKRLTDRRRKVR